MPGYFNMWMRFSFHWRNLFDMLPALKILHLRITFQTIKYTKSRKSEPERGCRSSPAITEISVHLRGLCSVVSCWFTFCFNLSTIACLTSQVWTWRLKLLRVACNTRLFFFSYPNVSSSKYLETEPGMALFKIYRAEVEYLVLRD